METSIKMAFFSMAIITSQLIAAVGGQTTATKVTADPATTTSLCCPYKSVMGGIWEDYDGYPDSIVIGEANVYVLESSSDYFTKPDDYCDDGCIYRELGTADKHYCFMSLQTPFVNPTQCVGISDSILDALGNAAGNAVDEIEDQVNPDDLDDAFDDFCLDPANADLCLERFRRVKRESGNSEDDLSTPMPNNSTRVSMLKRLTDKVIAYQIPTTSIINIVNVIIKKYIADKLVAKALEYRDEMVVEDANSSEGLTEKDKQDNIMRFNKILNLINRSVPYFF